MHQGFAQALLLTALAGGFALRAQPRLYSQETKNFRVVYYDPAHEYLVPLIVRSLENSLRFYKKTFGYEPPNQITVLVNDFEDFGNGSAGSVPTNYIQLGISPFSYVFDTFPATERISILASHELGHIVTADKPAKRDRVFRTLFRGKIGPNVDDPISIGLSFLASPRQYSPRWFHEGTAVFLETWMGGGFGRGLGGYDEMLFRSLVRDEQYIYEYIGLESEGTAADFQVGANSYLYGTRFMNHVVKKYGPEKLRQWMVRQEGGRAYFETEFRRLYGLTLREEWRHWIDAERQWQKENLATIRQYPVTKPQRISEKPLGSVSRTHFDAQTGLIYLAVKHAGKIAYLAALNPETGKIDPLTDVEGSALYFVTALAFDPVGRRLFFTTQNNELRGLSVYHLDTRRTRELSKDLRSGDYSFNQKDNSLWGLRHTNGLTSIARLEAPFENGKILHTFPFATDFSDVEVSRDGEWLSGLLTDESAKVRLVRFRTADLIDGTLTSEEIHDFGYNAPTGFTQSADGRYFYGSSYITGAANLFRIEVETRKLEALSNSETGLFWPQPLPDGSLIALEFTAQGFFPVKLPVKVLEDVNAISYLGQSVVNKYPQLKTWKLPPRSQIDDLELRTSAGAYQPLRNMGLISVHPIVQQYKTSPAAGLKFHFGDALMLSNAHLTASFSPDQGLPVKERFHAAFDARYWQWRLSGYFNKADFYDLFGPTKVARRGFGLRLDHTKILLPTGPRKLDWKAGVAGYAGLDRLPEYQNIAATRSRFLLGYTSLNYSRLARTLGAVEDEKGDTWRLDVQLISSPKLFPQIWGGYDKGFLTPLRNSSIWIRSSGGRAFGDRQDAFANFYFGGFGNNWIDKGNFSRYREFYAFPGAELNALSARDFAKSMVEWNLPPVRFRSAGFTSVYLNWARLSLFSGVLGANLSDGTARTAYTNAGVQVDIRLVWFTYMKSTLSVGGAAVRDRHGRMSSERMISLKLN
ncbi:MAG TPA: hypothetical protein DEH78_24685 [Solibacterales bacterium]|nr:hypothetical protein [Bryobacterales bacterium]